MAVPALPKCSKSPEAKVFVILEALRLNLLLPDAMRANFQELRSPEAELFEVFKSRGQVYGSSKS